MVLVADEQATRWFLPTPEEELRADVDTGVAHIARVYNYWLGGKDNFAADFSSPPSEVLGWSQFWSQLDECGRDEWPQLICVPRLVLGRWRRSRRRDEEEELYPSL
jgi:S-adenosyl methyltransferase